MDIPRIRVVVRKRPMSKKEINKNCRDIVTIIDPNGLIVGEEK